MDDMNDKPLYRLSEAAKLFDVSYGTVRRWCVDGTLVSVQLPSGQRRIPAWEIERRLARMEATQQVSE